MDSIISTSITITGIILGTIVIIDSCGWTILSMALHAFRSDGHNHA